MRRGPFSLGAAALVVGCVLCLPVVALAAPANDNIADREVLGGGLPIEVTRSNFGATKEGSEEVGSFAAGRSIWFEWTAPESRYYTIGACDSEIDSVLGVFTENMFGFLTRVVQGNSSEGPHCPFSGREYTVKATAGTAYVIGLDGNGFYLPGAPKPVTEGALTLRIEATPGPANDDFDAAASIDGRTTEEPGGHRFYFASLDGFNWNATEQVGEPDHAGDQGGASVWYRWTAPESGVAGVSTCCGTPTPIGVYRGESLGALTAVGSGLGWAEFPVTAEATYRIAVDGKYDEAATAPRVGSFSLRVRMELASARIIGDPPFQKTGPVPDRQGPVTTLVRRQIRHGARSATFRFRADEPATTFRCRLDRRKFTACRSPKTYTGLSYGRHTFRAYAVDAAGNADATPVASRFTLAAPKARHAAADH